MKNIFHLSQKCKWVYLIAKKWKQMFAKRIVNASNPGISAAWRTKMKYYNNNNSKHTRFDSFPSLQHMNMNKPHNINKRAKNSIDSHK